MVNIPSTKSTSAPDVAAVSVTDNGSKEARDRRAAIRSSKRRQPSTRVTTEQSSKRRRGRPPKQQSECSSSNTDADISHRPWLSEGCRVSETSHNITEARRVSADSARKARSLRKALCVRKRELQFTQAYDKKGKKKKKSDCKYDIVPCPSCHALLWAGESVAGEGQFSICCQQGRVRLPPVREAPSPLKELLESNKFQTHIRVANSLLAFTSMGANVDHSVTGTSGGPFTYRINGEVIHRIGSLLPEDAAPPEYLQLYIFDTDNELENRKRAFTQGSSSLALPDSMIVALIEMMDINNHLAKTFRHARDRFKDTGTIEYSITLVSQPNLGRQYDLPTAREIGGLIVGDLSATSVGKDIVVELKSSKLQRISDQHPLMMSLQYPLLFPYGEPGYNQRMPYEGPEVSRVRREYMTMREFYAYQIQTRPTEGLTIIKSGRLLHQYIVDAYVATEQERLRFILVNKYAFDTYPFGN